MHNYKEVRLGKHSIWIREGAEKRIEEIEGLVFDCDGVILDVSRSFMEAIIRTVKWFFGSVMEVRQPAVSLRHIQMFKNTGAFNNDWELTYALILYYLTDLLVKTRKIEVEKVDKVKIAETYNFFKELGRALKGAEVFFSEGLEEYVAEIGSEGLRKGMRIAARKLSEAWGVEDHEAARILEKLSPFEGEIHDKNIIKRFFEEVYCGGRLFKEIYEEPALFYSGKGLIEKEKPIVKRATLRKILKMGFPPPGIASGRMRKQTVPLLEKYRIKEYFNLEASTFLEEIEEKEREISKSGRLLKLDKPNPYPLVATASKMGIKNFAYIGDTVADVLACINAETQTGQIVMSIGVLCSAENKRELLAKFLELGCDLIIPTPNEIPKVIEGACGK
ncbi:MAG: hypothetical protein QXK43_01780 [Candidatus Jordarchaeales archaeon]